MSSRIVSLAAAAACVLALACESPRSVAPLGVDERLVPALPAQAVAAGNQRIEKVPLDFTFHIECDGEPITVHVVGFFQIQTFDREGARNLEVIPVNILVTFTNAAGETFRWREVGPDHFRLDRDGNVVHMVSGRAGNVWATIGHVVVDPETGAIKFIAGKEVGLTESNACAALT